MTLAVVFAFFFYVSVVYLLNQRFSSTRGNFHTAKHDRNNYYLSLLIETKFVHPCGGQFGASCFLGQLNLLSDT